MKPEKKLIENPDIFVVGLAQYMMGHPKVPSYVKNVIIDKIEQYGKLVRKQTAKEIIDKLEKEHNIGVGIVLDGKELFQLKQKFLKKD